MAVISNSFDSGTQGVTITAGNSATSGTAFNAVTGSTGAVAMYDNAHGAIGTMAAQIATGATSTTSILEWTTALGTQATIYGRIYMYFTANPAATLRVVQIANASGTCCDIQVTASGFVRVRNNGASTVTTTTNPIALNRWVRLEFMFFLDVAVGQSVVNLYNYGNSTVPTETNTSAPTQTFRGAGTTYRYGTLTAATNVAAFWLDEPAFSTTGYLGAVGGGDVPPTANAGSDQSVAANATVQLDGSGSSDSDGTVASYSWRIISNSTGDSVTLSSSTAQSPTFTAPAHSGTVVLGLTVTDNGDVPSTEDAVSITVTDTAPTAEAGPTQAVSINSLVTLAGSGTDPEGGTLTYTWRIISNTGPAVTLSSTSVQSPTFTSPGSAATITLGLKVTDTGGLQSPEDTTVVYVVPPAAALVRVSGAWVLKTVHVRRSGVWVQGS
jgi:hypothetical protein